MTTYPITYNVEVERRDEWPMTIRSGLRPALASGPPPEFHGSADWWSPEHLLVSALASCFTATFFASARAARLSVVTFTCHGTGVLDRTPKGGAFTGFRLDVIVTVDMAADEARARKLVDDVKRQCFVANSLAAPVEVNATVRIGMRDIDAERTAAP